MFATVPSTCKSTYFQERGGRKPFCHVKLSNQPHFLLLTSSASVCSDASFLVPLWAYESRKIAWDGTSFSTISYVSILNQNKSTQMPVSSPLPGLWDLLWGKRVRALPARWTQQTEAPSATALLSFGDTEPEGPDHSQHVNLWVAGVWSDEHIKIILHSS